LRRNFLLKHVTEGKLEVTGRRGRICAQLWNELKGRRYRKFKEEALDRIVWRVMALKEASGIPSNFIRGEGGSTNSVEDRGHRERGSGGRSPLVRGSGGSCNLVQEISFHIVKFS